jgi:hypothetical protein
VLDKPVPSLFGSRFWGLFFGGTIFGVLPGFVFRQFLLESLILAQDERWRRA